MSGEASMGCVTCGEGIYYAPGIGLVGTNGVCRDPLNPNDDNEGQHIVPLHGVATKEREQ